MPSSTLLENVELLSFDAGFTLLEPYPAVGEVYAAEARKMGVEADPETLTTRFYEVWQTEKTACRKEGRKRWTSDRESREWWSLIVDRVFDGMVQPDLQQDLARACFLAYSGSAHWRPFPEVLDCLKRLQKMGSRMVVLSNWDSRLNLTLDELNLTPFFERVCISSEWGMEKPDPELFQSIALVLGVDPGQILHIGDDPLEDVEGAREAGCRTLLIDRSCLEPRDGVITSLQDLL